MSMVKDMALILTRISLPVVFVEAGDVFNADLFGAGGFALIGVGTIPEALGIHLFDHVQGASVFFHFALGQNIQMHNLGSHK